MFKFSDRGGGNGNGRGLPAAIGYARSMADTLTGAIERVTFHNLDNGYCVLRVQARGHRDPVTVVGHLPQAIAGEYIEAAGEWVVDKNHGPQFKADNLRTTPPHTAEGIARYLGSGLVKGIGKTYARKIVDVFGERTLDVIDKSPAYLTQVKGIGPKRIERIREGWHEQKAVRSILIFLQSHGIGTARAVRIYKQYGDSAVEQVRANPYRLATDIWGVGFRTADELALRLGIPRDAPQRAQAAVRHVLQEAASDGHVGLPEELLVEETARLTQISTDQVREAIEALRVADEVIRESKADAEEVLLYLKPLYLAEVGLARSVRDLRGGPHPLAVADAGKALAWAEARMGIEFAAAQRDAVRAALTEKVLVLTGGPGTGKTTIVRAIIELYRARNRTVALCAPTGRAAKRLSEATGREARTIHRLLEYDAALGGFRRSKDNPIEADLVVVDETSMADVALANQLLRAVAPETAVVLVGDVDQLPSVGPGSVLRDLIDSGAVAVVRLTQIHRQAGSSWIVRAAHAVNHGDEPASAPAGGDGDFFVIEVEDENTIVDRVITLVKDRIPARFGLDPFADVQVLAPMNKTTTGVRNLNARLQEALNPAVRRDRDVHRYGSVFRPGDKVLQTRNNYTREVFNGDIGRVTNVDPIDQVLTVTFDGRGVDYDFGDLDELQLAYAITIHQSQGSEYPAVVIPLHTTHFIMLRRNLLYTGLTRGKKLVVLVGSRRALGIAVRTADTVRRFSLLKWRLQEREDPTTGSAGLFVD
jgi:exodeoxyribonuclease V alpha subunit